MKQLLKWAYAIACLYWVYLAGNLFLNVLISDKYNTFSPSDIQYFKWTLVYAVFLVVCSLMLLFLGDRRH